MTHNSYVLDTATIQALIERFDGDEFSALLMAGSRARGSAGPHSDVDLVRLCHTDEARKSFPNEGSHLVDGWLVTVNTLTQARVEEIFSEPEPACDMIGGLRTAQMLVDPAGVGAQLQRRARDFVWDASMQAKANQWATEQMVGWIEECHKGLEGLRRNDTGRMLNARFGLSWGLSWVVKVQRGVLLSGDNGTWDEINRAVGETSTWVRLRRIAYGLEDESGKAAPLREQVTAGLRLYCATAAMLEQALVQPEADMIRATVERIESVIGKVDDGWA